jgi:hypothetical protein
MVSLMVDVQNRFLEKISILTPTRRLLRTDTFYVFTDGDEKKGKGMLSSKKDFLREIFLFNDLFIIAKPVKDERLSLVKMCATDALSYSDMEAHGEFLILIIVVVVVFDFLI